MIATLRSIGAIALLITVVSSGEAAQTGPDLRWVQQFGTAGTVWDHATAVAVDGEAYVVGSFDATGGPDAFARKFDSDGNVVWTRQFGTSNFDRGLGVAVHSSGVYVVGETYRTFPGQVNPGGFDAFVRKYDVFGNELWTRQFGFPVTVPFIPADHATAVFVDASGVYVAGWTETNNRDAFVAKYGHSGTLIWLDRFGTNEANVHDLATGIAGDASGIYVVGVLAGHGFVRKYDAGALSPQTPWTTTFPFAALNAVSAAPSGIYVAGSISGNGRDAVIGKYDTDGNQVWTHVFGTWADDEAQGVSASESGVYVTGFAGAALPGRSAVGGHDVFIRKYDEDGNEAWTEQFGTIAGDEGHGIATAPSGVYVAGSTEGIFADNSGSGGLDAFAARFAELPHITVAIDIKPGATPNTINLGSRGSIAVAIFSSTDFDATTIDPSTVRLAGAAVELKGRGTPMATVQDVNGDGLDDYVVHVETDALQLSEVDAAAVLKAKTTNEILITGTDSVRIVR